MKFWDENHALLKYYPKDFSTCIPFLKELQPILKDYGTQRKQLVLANLENSGHDSLESWSINMMKTFK
jgi:hypothetical protein